MDSSNQLTINIQNNYDLNVFLGDSYLLKITITDKDETVLDLTGKTTTINIRKYTGSSVLVTGSAVNLVQSGVYKGMCIFQLTPTMTGTTLERGSYILEVVYNHSATEIKTIKGNLTIE